MPLEIDSTTKATLLPMTIDIQEQPKSMIAQQIPEHHVSFLQTDFWGTTKNYYEKRT